MRNSMEDSELRTGEHILLRMQVFLSTLSPMKVYSPTKGLFWQIRQRSSCRKGRFSLILSGMRKQPKTHRWPDPETNYTGRDQRDPGRRSLPFHARPERPAVKNGIPGWGCSKRIPLSVPEQEHHTTTPALNSPQKKHSYTIQPEIEVMPPAPRHITGLIRTTVKKEVTWTTSTEWIGESSPSSLSSALTKAYGSPPPGSSPLRNKESYRLVFGLFFLSLS